MRNFSFPSNPRVILRAFRELFAFAYVHKWHHEEQQEIQAQVVSHQRGAQHDD
jgi:hypothetical protein